MKVGESCIGRIMRRISIEIRELLLSQTFTDANPRDRVQRREEQAPQRVGSSTLFAIKNILEKFAKLSRHFNQLIAGWRLGLRGLLCTSQPASRLGRRGTITMFNGLRFDDDHPFHYREAKR